MGWDETRWPAADAPPPNTAKLTHDPTRFSGIATGNTLKSQTIGGNTTVAMASQDGQEQSPDVSVADQLDNEIASLRAQVESLKRHLSVQTSNILIADSTRDFLQDLTERKPKTGSAKSAEDAAKLLKRSDEYIAHKQQCLYRACASITAFKVRDPDPNAVDGGTVLGLRFEVMSKARFLRPYYVMLNRPYANSRHLRVHRHTVPPCVPLSGLAARHLPAPKAKEDGGAAEQDLPLFARALRRELVRYQNRINIVGDLHKAAGLDKSQPQQKESDVSVVHISPADAEAKQISIEWNDGKVGRLVMDDDGKIVKMAVQGENGRDRRAVRELLGGSVRIEEILGRLEVT